MEVSRWTSELSHSICKSGSAHVSHSFRLEHKLGPRLKVVALVDPSVGRAEKVLEGKRASFVESAYRDTKVFPTIEDYHTYLENNKAAQPKCVYFAPNNSTEVGLS